MKYLRRFQSIQLIINDYFLQPQNHLYTINYDLRNMIINDPEHVYRYFQFEYKISLLYSIALMLCIYALLNIEFVGTFKHFRPDLFKYWLYLGLILNGTNILCKFITLHYLRKTVSQHKIIMIHLLMILVKSYCFNMNSKASFALYVYYVFTIWRYFVNFNSRNRIDLGVILLHIVVSTIILRLINHVMRYFLEFKFMDRNIVYVQNYNQRLSHDRIDSFEVITLTKDDNINKQQCGICLMNFNINEKITILPCSDKHRFHKSCSDFLFRNHYQCPYCRKKLW